MLDVSLMKTATVELIGYAIYVIDVLIHLMKLRFKKYVIVNFRIILKKNK